jgi:hypothetical protein
VDAPGTPAVAEQIEALPGLSPIEVLVAIHVLDGGEEVAGMLDAACGALAERFPGKATAVLALDMGSTDGTRDRLATWASGPAGAAPHRLVLAPPQTLGAGRAASLLLSAAARLETAVTVLVSGELSAMSRAALVALAEPVATGAADWALPAYTRRAGEGTLSTNLLAPLAGALWGRGVQQAVGGCLALATGRPGEGPLASAGLDAWDGPGAELWLTATALASAARVAQVHLGRRPARRGGREPDVPTIIAQTLAPLFALMERQPDSWIDAGRTVAVPVLGEAPALLADPEPHRVDRLVRAFRLGLKDLLPVWELAMSQGTLGELYPLALLPAEEFRLAPWLWARVVSDFALAHHERRLPRDHLYRSLAPLYLGRVAAFFNELRQEPGDPGAVLLRVAQAFEAEKPALAARWR